MEGEVQSAEPEIVADRKCPECSSDLVIKVGRYGKFIGCSAYPKCKHMEPLEKPETTETACPKCDSGHLMKRRSRRGTFFYSCDQYPKCRYAVWNEPVNQPCKACKWPFVTLKVTKKFGREYVCPECNHKEPAPAE